MPWECPECHRVYHYGDPGPVAWKGHCQRCGSPDFVTEYMRERASATKPGASQ